MGIMNELGDAVTHSMHRSFDRQLGAGKLSHPRSDIVAVCVPLQDRVVRVEHAAVVALDFPGPRQKQSFRVKFEAQVSGLVTPSALKLSTSECWAVHLPFRH
jgi:hypothetical protein